ncbi:MAG: hypothetical protein ACRDHZ_20945, partial [Ktedonobacteraceae bacterium]
MARSTQRPPRQGGLSQISATVTLALWQLRLTWRLLLVSGAGVVAAVILVCTVPLYSQVAMSAGLRDVLNGSDNATITIHGVAHLISHSATQKVADQIQQELQQNLGQQQLAGSQFSTQSPALPLVQSNDQVQLSGWPMPSAGSHVHVLEGRLPQDGGSTLEVALTSEAATHLNLTVGSTFTVTMAFLDPLDHEILSPLTLHVVGIFAPNSAGDNYWHGTSFASVPQGTQGVLYPVLASSKSYLNVLETVSNVASGGNPQN